MKYLIALFVILFCVCTCTAVLSKDEVFGIIKSDQFKQEMKFVQETWRKAQEWQKTTDIGDMSFECALCGIALNEIEGFLVENLTMSEMETAIKTDICAHVSGFLQIACDDLVTVLPVVLSRLEHRWDVSQVCVDLTLCQKPFQNHTDPVQLPRYVLNLDLDPEERWNEICSNDTYKNVVSFLINTVDGLLPGNGTDMEALGRGVNAFLDGNYAKEIQGCASTMGIGYGWLTLFNLGYEVSDACTSILAQTEEGQILHARNLDFWAGMGFTDSLKEMALILDVQRSGKTLFKASTFAGYVGVLSGMKEGGFSVTIDTRFYPKGIAELFYEVVAAIEENNATLVAFLTRDALMYAGDWSSAVNQLSNSELVADVYYIVGGVSAGQGAVISRNRHNATNVWLLDAAVGRWWILETNYDHWEPAPWFDDRRLPANNAMKAMGRQDLTLDGMYKVLSTKPVFNIQTTYSFTAVAGNGTYNTVARYCPYPCTE